LVRSTVDEARSLKRSQAELTELEACGVADASVWGMEEVLFKSLLVGDNEALDRFAQAETWREETFLPAQPAPQ